jgi:hypothetical protein
MPSIDLTDEELAALASLVRRALEQDRFPLAARLLPLRSAFPKLEAAIPEPQPPKAPQAGKRGARPQR